MTAWHALVDALTVAGAMTWEILWALILGFCLSAIVQAVVRREAIIRLLGDDRPRTLTIAAGLGAASSSCSYAAVALARSLFRRGANFTAAMAFEIASTNLVIELGIIMALLLGWQFTLAEFVGGPLMIMMLAVLFRRFLSQRLLNDARVQAERGVAGSMEGHAAMDMSVAGQGTVWQRLHTYRFTCFVCSIRERAVGCVAVEPGGISFGGVISFIFADLIILPILVIYRKYYGTKMMLFILWTFYLTMVVAGYLVEIIFGVLHLVPSERNAQVLEPQISWNYTTFLNLIFIALAAALLWRFFRTGGRQMLAMMNGPPDMGGEHVHLDNR